MSRLASRAEQAKLARELGVPDAGLDFLADLPPEALRHFRVAVTDLFFDEQRLLLRWLASVARWLPSWLSALLARRAKGRGGADQQQLRLRMTVQKGPAGGQCDARAMVPAHAVHGDAHRAEGFGCGRVCHG